MLTFLPKGSSTLQRCEAANLIKDVHLQIGHWQLLLLVLLSLLPRAVASCLGSCPNKATEQKHGVAFRKRG
jgi:hypothetical protein